MIQVSKESEPDILKENKSQWTDNLMALVSQYGSYNKIPPKEKDLAVEHYAHSDIRAALQNGKTNAKCVYCESYLNVTGYPSIEHYYPKSIYPEHTFAWDNLFLSCTLCNVRKSNFDTKRNPFIHPQNDNPEDYLTFDNLIYTPISKIGLPYQKARNLIDNCNLERLELVRKHGEIFISFLKIMETLKVKLDQYESYKLAKKRLWCACDILSSMKELDEEASNDAEYAAFMRYLLRKYDEVKDAVKVIDAHKDELGLSNGFQWCFKF